MNLYQLTFALQSPMHIGYHKVGNIQRARSYLQGKNLWGALTARLTRFHQYGLLSLPITRSNYRACGDLVKEQLVFSYFYPALAPDKPLCPRWSEGKMWYGDGSDALAEETFQWRFMGSYASTALNYDVSKSAEEGTLHEIEYLSPYTRDEGRQVLLIGYVIEQDGCTIPCWRDGDVLNELQMGGERGYGWGRLALQEPAQLLPSDHPLFGRYRLEGGWPPQLSLPAGSPLLAHTLAVAFDDAGGMHCPLQAVEGPIEPVVGREWMLADILSQHAQGAGRWISPARICWTPGSRVTAETTVQIGPYGIWEASTDGP